jgi:predicted dehydrogenase
MAQPHFLIVGAGSVGKRHLRNFAKLGCSVSAFDPRADRIEEAANETALQNRYTRFDDALAATDLFDGVVICSPPSFHVAQSIVFLSCGVPVLLEKPVSPDVHSAQKLAAAVAKSTTPLLLGYTYRWWPALAHFKNRLLAGEIGAVKYVDCTMSAHLADWHPWERYQDFFMASRELGGGALLDESHFVDLILWIFGRPEEVFARVEKISDLEISTDDHVEAQLEYESGLRVAIHLDLYGRPHEKYIRATGLKGTLHWSFDPNRIRFSNKMGQEWQDQTFTEERNDMFLNVAKEFIDVVAHRRADLSCTAQDGLDVLSLVEAMRQSSSEKRMLKPSYL